MQICKEIFFSIGGKGTPLPESQNFWDIIGKNLVIFHKFSRFISEKINSFNQNMFQLMCEKKKGEYCLDLATTTTIFLSLVFSVH